MKDPLWTSQSSFTTICSKRRNLLPWSQHFLKRHEVNSGCAMMLLSSTLCLSSSSRRPPKLQATPHISNNTTTTIHTSSTGFASGGYVKLRPTSITSA
ncbi:hypothetical protein B0H21DRAFT_889558 [Amylocystis lapponica]|nr:hypothetical protein B0H21DRAFT_889558 [Amylocystis lapponica]